MSLAYLILGGTGYIGANFTKYLLDNKLASSITVADLKPPGRCFLPEELLALYTDHTIEFLHSDLAQDAHVERLFAPERKQYDVIVDCIAETRTSFSPDVVRQKMVTAIQKVLDKVAAISKDTPKVPFFIEMSTAQVYEPTGKPSDEGGKTKPFTVVAGAKLEMENHMKTLYSQGLQGCILRPALVYGGFNEFNSIAPRLCCAATYQKTGEKMEFLWSKSLQINTVHIADVCKAIVWVAENRKLCNQGILNLCDSGNTTQGSLNAIIEAMFGIQTGFAGTILSNLAKLKLRDLTADANDSHQPIWLALNKELGIPHTPYTTYISMELLYNNPLCIDGTNITKLIKSTDKTGTPFTYDYPTMTHQLVYDALFAAQQRNLFPKIQLQPPK